MDSPTVTTDQPIVTIEMPQETVAQPEQQVQPQVQPSEPVVETKPEEVKPKHAGGRPCQLCQHLEEYQIKLKQYIDECRGKDSKKPRVPYLMEFADIVDVDKETIIDWSDKINAESKELEHPEFHRLIKVCENLQELRCNQRLMGRYNPTGAIFLLKTKHKYIETEKKLLGNDNNTPLQIEIIEERSLPDES